MIPKKIHYCWFGGNPMPELMQKCVSSWKQFCPEYEIVEWNETNFDVNCCNYAKEAYEAKKWAFVSDYARFWIIYHQGGVYFDTDVEIIRPINDIVERGPFFGCEYGIPERLGEYCACVAPGLGLAAEAGDAVYRKILDEYEAKHFLRPDGANDLTTVVKYTTDLLKPMGFSSSCKEIQNVAGIWIYPPEYFCPINYQTSQLQIGKETRTIHHYTSSWHDRTLKGKIKKMTKNLLGPKLIQLVLHLKRKIRKKEK